jgi:hypothetical protein
VNELEISVIGKPEKWLIATAASIGLDYAGLTHEVTSHFRNHVINRHGNPAKHGAATVADTDFDKIPAMVKTPDTAIIGASRRGSLFNIYIKIEVDITYLYFEEVLDSNRNKALRSSTFYKVTRPLSLDDVLKNVVRNNKTDISKAKIFIMTKP